MLSKNGEQLVWSPIFRRNLDDKEIEDFAALLIVSDSVFIVDGRKDKGVYKGKIDGSFSVVSFFFFGLMRWCSLKISF